jgi:small conductance mechanosensitive channel
MLKQKKHFFIIFMLFIVSFLVSGSFGQEAEPKYTATTTADPQVPVEDLELLLKPLTKTELIAEIEEWLQLLRSKVSQISTAEIQTHQKSREIEQKKAADSSVENANGPQQGIEGAAEAEIELQTKAKEQLLVNITKLREEQAALIERFNVVLSALKDKGGDVEEYEKYVAAVSGLGVNIQDVSAFRIIVWGWLKSPKGGLRWLKNIVFFLLTLLAFYILANFLGKITLRTVSSSKRFSDLLKNFFVSLVRKTVMLIGIIVALSMLEVQVTPFIATLGVAGFILGFALQGTLSNFASGLMILIYRPYDVGHVIETAGMKGKVDSMNLVSTTIKTFDNQIVVVPNGEIWGGVITNVTGSDTRRVDMKFGISYSDDIAKAAKILEDIVSKHELVLKDPEPVIRLHELGDSSVNFVCRPWAKTEDYWTVYWDVTRAVKERFDAEGVSIPFPQRDVHIYQTSKGN